MGSPLEDIDNAVLFSALWVEILIPGHWSTSKTPSQKTTQRAGKLPDTRTFNAGRKSTFTSSANVLGLPFQGPGGLSSGRVRR